MENGLFKCKFYWFSDAVCLDLWRFGIGQFVTYCVCKNFCGDYLRVVEEWRQQLREGVRALSIKGLFIFLKIL